MVSTGRISTGPDGQAFAIRSASSRSGTSTSLGGRGRPVDETDGDRAMQLGHGRARGSAQASAATGWLLRAGITSVANSRIELRIWSGGRLPNENSPMQ